MRPLDVLLINPSALGQIYQKLSSDLAAIEPPIWAAMIANHLRAKGRAVDLLDCEGLNLTLEEATAEVGAREARLYVIVVYGQQPSASTQNMHAASQLCRSLKRLHPEKKILLLGGHVSALPERTLREEPADFLAKGEGVFTIDGLLDAGFTDSSLLAKVPGLWYRDESGNILSAPPAPLVASNRLAIDLPGMAFDLLPMKNYRAHNWHCFGQIGERQPYASIYTSLGCPYRCAFCCINAPFGGSQFRHWDPQFMIGQFDLLAEKYGVKNIKIADEMFVLKEPHFLELCRLLKERAHGFNIWAYSRVDTIKPRHLDSLKAAGVNWIALGIESKSKFVRDGVGKGRFQDEAIYQVVREVQGAGMNVIGNYIFGLPDDDYASMQATLDLALELNCEMGNFYSAMAYPGSQLYEMAIREKWPLPDSWLGYSQHAFEARPLPTRHISGGEVLGFRDAAWKKYFTAPAYLAMVRQKFGEATLRHIQEITQIDIPRKYAIQPKEIRL